MHWREIELDRAIWVIPKERSKNKRAHLVPLTRYLVRLLELHWPPESRRGFLFKSTKGTPLTSGGHSKDQLDRAIAARVERAGSDGVDEREEMAPFQLHDLRRTLATGLQRLGVPVEHTEAVLNHVTGTRSHLVDIYQLYKYEPEKRVALEKWHSFIEELTSRTDACPGGTELE
mgnify:CR=1 FL=1